MMPGEQPANTYILDAESGAEMARLLNQDRLLTRAMGGTFPERTDDLATINKILDIGCGPGGWVLDVAHQYQEKQVVGIDISRNMVQYAHAHASAQGLDNASFQVMDALQPFAFDDESFDLVNARLIATFMPTKAWPELLKECFRILRPGGVIRLTEGEVTVSTSQAYDQLTAMVPRLLKKIGYSFSHDEWSWGIVPVLRRLLHKAGFQNIQKKVHLLETAPDLEGYNMWVDNIKVAFQLLEPRLLKMGFITQEEFKRLYNTALIDMLSDEFSAMAYFVTMWGTKPS